LFFSGLTLPYTDRKNTSVESKIYLNNGEGKMLIKNYTNLSITTPDCHPGAQVWCADFNLDADISHLFPYINAVVDGAVYHEKPHCILFFLENIKFSIYPDKVSAAPFIDREHAIERIQVLIHFLNELENKKTTIAPNHKRYRPPVPVLEIFKLLPRTNCKKCDFPTCMAFAAALSKQEVMLDQCLQFQDDRHENIIKLNAMFQQGETSIEKEKTGT
jgi:ArsR family metal-binding transcriptional regulator